ncbi:ankyrin repeat domain-containing protein [Sphingomonas aracearum]|uniref:Ankyrin repeat domain-containing protein n=1 Tax=Sphingomonas aracearum TaxID=2283317 RepID=A0A369VU93_9SPHN|nr:ankyrin repeat domain-containing protein [Sphingomonas aracearum]RDE04642.1 ankyrin repeat domain-containing protein [Sphingomonas aracearum]
MKRILPSAILASAIVAAPAPAQRMSDSYLFLKALRDEDGNKVNSMVTSSGGAIINTARDISSGESALHVTVRGGNLTYTRFLLDRGANPNVEDGKGDTPLLLATAANRQDLVEALLNSREVKANVNMPDARGFTALIRAVQNRNLALVTLLLKAGADPDRTENGSGYSARDYARQASRSPELLKAIEAAPKVNKAPVSGPVLRR